MTELVFKGKEFVRNHHLGVPFRPLKPVAGKSVGKVDMAGNLVLHGDNLHALKSLLPVYAGRVNCIYIDPPYNTGNEGWCYNDNVNSPLIREWLSDNPVDVEDGLRHDKWLCMMYPRLMLLRELLADDGVIFVSIDDNEQHRLRFMMDEIFGEGNFIANIVVRTNPGGRDYGGIAQTHDYVLVYGNGEESSLGMLAVDADELPMSDGIGGFELRELRNRNKRFNSGNRPNLYYPFYVNPKGADEHGLHEVSLTQTKGWVEVYPLESAGVKTVWRWGKERVHKHINVNVKAKQKRDGSFQIVEKFRRVGTRERSIMDHTDYRNELGTLTVKSLLGVSGNFDYPKSEAMIRRLLELGAHEDSIVLDSFAGSGTTAHAVLALNKEDGGNRKFILVECEDYADAITAERVRRVIKGVPKARDESLREGLGGTFTYCTLGAPVEMDGLLRGKNLPPFEALGAVLFHTATNEAFDAAAVEHGEAGVGYLGEGSAFHVWLIYRPDLEFLKSADAALTLDLAHRIAERDGEKRHVVFAAARYVSQKLLDEAGLNVGFAPLPFALYRSGGL